MFDGCTLWLPQSWAFFITMQAMIATHQNFHNHCPTIYNDRHEYQGSREGSQNEPREGDLLLCSEALLFQILCICSGALMPQDGTVRVCSPGKSRCTFVSKTCLTKLTKVPAFSVFKDYIWWGNVVLDFWGIAGGLSFFHIPVQLLHDKVAMRESLKSWRF